MEADGTPPFCGLPHDMCTHVQTETCHKGEVKKVPRTSVYSKQTTKMHPWSCRNPLGYNYPLQPSMCAGRMCMGVTTSLDTSELWGTRQAQTSRNNEHMSPCGKELNPWESSSLPPHVSLFIPSRLLISLPRSLWASHFNKLRFLPYAFSHSSPESSTKVNKKGKGMKFCKFHW